MAEAALPRPGLSGRDPLGLRRALSDRLLPALVAAMTLLAALALAGASGAAALAERWQGGVATTLTVQLPSDAGVAAALAALRALPEVAAAQPVDQARLAGLLRPWLGDAPADLSFLRLPAIIELRLVSLPLDPAALAARVHAAVPGASVETYGIWVARLVSLSESLRTLALGALALVIGIATTVIAVAVRAGVAARRDTIAILHAFGSTDADIAGRFARRVAALVGLGAALGVVLAVPLLAAFAALAAPLVGRPPGGSLTALPWSRLPWQALAILPFGAAFIGWATAQATLRLWLRRLP